MAEYIETDLLKMAIEAELFMNDSTKAAFRSIVRKVPAADVAPVVHGEWLNKEVDELRCHVYGNCSVCHERKRIDNYCPNCGAKMGGGSNG